MHWAARSCLPLLWLVPDGHQAHPLDSSKKKPHYFPKDQLSPSQPTHCHWQPLAFQMRTAVVCHLCSIFRPFHNFVLASPRLLVVGTFGLSWLQLCYLLMAAPLAAWMEIPFRVVFVCTFRAHRSVEMGWLFSVRSLQECAPRAIVSQPLAMCP